MVDTPQAAQPTPAQPDQLRRLAALFGALDKCVRATRLYQGEGDMLARMQQQLLEKSDGALSDGAVTVRLAPFGLLLEGRTLAPGEDLPPHPLQPAATDMVNTASFFCFLFFEWGL